MNQCRDLCRFANTQATKEHVSEKAPENLLFLAARLLSSDERKLQRILLQEETMTGKFERQRQVCGETHGDRERSNVV